MASKRPLTDTRRPSSDRSQGLAMNTTNVRLVRLTLPVTCQQPSVGNELPLAQKRPPATSAKAVSGTPLLIRARSGATEASTRRPWMVSSPVVPTVHHGYFWLVEPSGSGVPPCRCRQAEARSTGRRRRAVGGWAARRVARCRWRNRPRAGAGCHVLLLHPADVHCHCYAPRPSLVPWPCYGSCSEATCELLARIGVDLAVAHVEGDDLSERVPELLAAGHDLARLDTGAPFSSWGRQPLTANAYLGGFGIAAAVEAGADVVVTGRVADASLVSGVAAWWWGWTPGDHDALAGAVVAGHVIECGAQATGGNFSGFREIADLAHPGFPLAEIDQDGSSVITKHPGTGGAVTVDTVTAQLLYEVDGPGYLNPDVVARLDTVRLERSGVDRVRIAGVAGLPPPPTTKLAITGLGGWRNGASLVLTGLDLDDKAEVAEASVRARLEGLPGITDLRFTRIGVAAGDPVEQMAGSGSALGAYWPTLIPQTVPWHTVVHPDGRRQPITPPPASNAWSASAPAPAGTGGPTLAPGGPATPAPAPAGRRADFGPTVDGPLGRLVHARSGDKGGNANVGLWVSDPAAWPWLAATMTTERFRALAPEAAGLRIDRHE